MTRFQVLFIALAVLFGLGAGTPPETEVKKVVDDYHGTKVADPYRWLEGSSAPEIEGEDPELDEQVSQWMDSQNDYTRSVLDNLPGREKLEARLRELMEIGSVRTPTVRRNRYFFWKREGDQAQFIIYMQEGKNGDPRVVVQQTLLHGHDVSQFANRARFTLDGTQHAIRRGGLARGQRQRGEVDIGTFGPRPAHSADRLVHAG